MQKLLLTLGLSGLLAGAAQAQVRTRVGLQLAYGRTWLGGQSDAAYNRHYHSAYQGGVTADVYFNDAFSFRPEVLYSWRAYDADNEDYNRDLSYLDIPLLARYHASGLYLEAGPQVSIPLTAKDEAGDNVKSQANSVALNYVLGLGYQLNGGLSLGLRYDAGFTNVFKSDQAVIGTDKLKSHTGWVTLGYSFGGR